MGNVAGRGKLSVDDDEEGVNEEMATKSSRWLRALLVLTGSSIEDMIRQAAKQQEIFVYNSGDMRRWSEGTY
jgi:hypothetical protein